MKGYLIAIIDVTDPDGYEQYKAEVPAVIEQFGGRYLVRGGRVVSLEGGWDPKRVAVLEFDSLDRAREFYESEAYSGPKGIRQRTSTSQLILLEGV